MDRLYDRANTIGLTEDDVKELKVLWEIAQIQGSDAINTMPDVKTEELLSILKKTTDGQHRAE